MDTKLTNREIILAKLRAKLLKAQEAMKHFADAKCMVTPFQLGDLVMVRLRPYRQISVTGDKVQKLAKRYYGPFLIVRCIGEALMNWHYPQVQRYTRYSMFHS